MTLKIAAKSIHTALEITKQPNHQTTIKHKNSIITSCVALALAGSAHAAGVWSTINWTNDSALSFTTPEQARRSP